MLKWLSSLRMRPRAGAAWLLVAGWVVLPLLLWWADAALTPLFTVSMAVGFLPLLVGWLGAGAALAAAACSRGSTYAIVGDLRARLLIVAVAAWVAAAVSPFGLKLFFAVQVAGDLEHAGGAVLLPMFDLLTEGIVWLFAGFALFRRVFSGRRARAAIAGRPGPVLVVRSFSVDREESLTSRENPFSVVRHNQQVSSAFGLWSVLIEGSASLDGALAAPVSRRVGPLVAIGDPLDWFPRGGARRLYVGDGDWKAEIADAVQRSQLVLIFAGETPGLRWELSHLRANCPARRLVVVREQGAAAWPALCEVFASAGPRLPEEDPGNALIGFDDAYEPIVLVRGTLPADQQALVLAAWRDLGDDPQRPLDGAALRAAWSARVPVGGAEPTLGEWKRLVFKGRWMGLTGLAFVLALMAVTLTTAFTAMAVVREPPTIEQLTVQQTGLRTEAQPFIPRIVPPVVAVMLLAFHAGAPLFFFGWRGERWVYGRVRRLFRRR